MASAWLLLACGSGHYEHYRQTHPGWRPALPEASGGLPEVLAGLEAPDGVPGIRVDIGPVEVLRFDGERWQPIAFAVGATPPDGDLAVVARRTCRADIGFGGRFEARIASYLLPAGALDAYDHRAFDAGCEVSEAFRAARPETAAMERALADYVTARHGRQPLSLIGLYRRGLAYVEAGRIAEARGVLSMGERSFHQAIRGPGVDGSEIKRLRERLRRALGRTSDTP
ncbi:MAG: hypothetical protein AAF430_00920 [Myxococcota bacterium]